MSFSRPTLATILARVKTDLQNNLTSGAAVLRRSVIAVISAVVAGASHVMHGHLAYISLQLLPTTSDEEYLLQQGNLFNITRKPASFTLRNVLFTGSVGSVIDTTQEVQTAAGLLFKVSTGGTFTGTTLLLPVQAEMAGADSNVPTGTQLTLVNPAAGVNNTAVVDASGQTDGVALEDIEVYRARVLFRYANPAQGGTLADYQVWAKEVPFVTRAFVYPGYLGPGTVGITFVEDGSTSGSIIPSSQDVATVQAYIDARRPVTANAVVFAPTASPVNFNIHLIGGDTAAIRAAVIAELQDLFRREATPAGRLYLSHINEAISTAAGEVDHTLVTPTSDVVTTTGVIPTVGTITWS